MIGSSWLGLNRLPQNPARYPLKTRRSRNKARTGATAPAAKLVGRASAATPGGRRGPGWHPLAASTTGRPPVRETADAPPQRGCLNACSEPQTPNPGPTPHTPPPPLAPPASPRNPPKVRNPRVLFKRVDSFGALVLHPIGRQGRKPLALNPVPFLPKPLPGVGAVLDVENLVVCAASSLYS